ncbi:MAG: hypothetical protein JSS41_08015 [Proteobacteria bacterium]|nr:hypothetical protein [Pseudomonadota bacterium]
MRAAPLDGRIEARRVEALSAVRGEARIEARRAEAAIEPWFETDRLELRSRPILLTTNGNQVALLTQNG